MATSAMADPEQTETDVECERCGYVWTYTGELWVATCPRCNHKTPSGLKPDEFCD